MIALVRLGPSAPAIAIARIRAGKARKTSVRRMSASSTRPPLYPATSPTTVPKTPADATTTTPMMSEIRAPYRIRLAMSRPSESVPSQWSGDGGIKREPSAWRSGSYGAITGAKSAHNANTPMSANATMFSGLERIGARATSLRPRTPIAAVLTMLRPGVEPEVRDVDHEVGDRIHDGGEQRHPQHGGKIQGDRGRGGVPP